MEKVQSLKKKSIISTISLFLQSGYSALLGFAANVILTIYLDPRIFGIYITVLSIIALLNYFSDIGLAASLIQKEHISDEDVTTAFTLQQMLILTLVTIGFLVTKPLMSFYHLAGDGQMLYWALLFGFFISSLKTIPSVFLERAVKFHKIVMVQIVENTIFYGIVIYCAIHGLGLLSFAYGVVARALIGLIVMYSISFWMPRIGIYRKSIRTLLSYGAQFQSMSFLALFKDDLVNVFLGKFIGFEALGYIGWGKRWAESVLRIIMDNISRVVFPLFARVQGDVDKQKKVIDTLLRIQSMILIPASLGLIVVMPLIIELLPKYEKWRPALPIFYIFVLSSLFSSYSTPFINYFNGIGKVRISLGFMIFWTAMTWILIIPMTHFFGMFGPPLTILLLSMTSVVVMMKARTIVAFDFMGSTLRYIISGACMAAVALIVRSLTISLGYGSLALVVGAGGIVYYAVLFFLFKENLIQDLYNEFQAA